jgi:hypothetical protein
MKSVDEMKEQIIELVPVGTPIAEARKTMEEHGYRCSSELRSEGKPAKLCCRKESQTSWATTHTWAVDVSYDDTNLVKDVTVRSWGTGL